VKLQVFKNKKAPREAGFVKVKPGLRSGAFQCTCGCGVSIFDTFRRSLMKSGACTVMAGLEGDGFLDVVGASRRARPSGASVTVRTTLEGISTVTAFHRRKVTVTVAFSTRNLSLRRRVRRRG